MKSACVTDRLQAVSEAQTTSETSAHFTWTDANGNVCDLIDTTGSTVAHYEYSPFGQVAASQGTLASANPWQFSSKYYDAETQLKYYGYRYLENGRWLNRDLIGEVGGTCLYGFIGNSVMNYIDLLGLKTCEELQRELDIVISIYDRSMKKLRMYGDNDSVFLLDFVRNNPWDVTATITGGLGQPLASFSDVLIPSLGVGGGHGLGMVSGIITTGLGISDMINANDVGGFSIGVGETGIGIIGTGAAASGMIQVLAPTMLTEGTVFASLAAGPVGWTLLGGTLIVGGLDVKYALDNRNAQQQYREDVLNDALELWLKINLEREAIMEEMRDNCCD